MSAGRPLLRSSDQHDENVSTFGGQVGAGARCNDSADGESYRLVSIDAVRAPDGCNGSDWHIYRIVQGENEITGYRRGELARVTADIETIVSALNGRRQWTKSKEPSRAQRRAAAAARGAVVK